MSQVDVYVAIPHEAGWEPIRKMARLLCSYLGTEPIYVDVKKSLSTMTKTLGLIPRLSFGDRKALVIAYDPGQLNAISQSPYVLTQYSEIYGWVIDSFWSERIPRIAYASKTYHHIFVTDPSDISEWKSAGVSYVSALPWGGDIWSNIGARLSIAKTNDLLRVGRQPGEWSDDEHTKQEAEKKGLSFQGRPAFGTSAEESASNLENALRESKIVLAFTNKVSPTNYTHPTKEYLTGRWIDALAWGCVVAGQVPQTQVSKDYLWEGATLYLPHEDLWEGLAIIAQYLEGYTEEFAVHQVVEALRNFDWRFRFEVLLNRMSVSSVDLDNDVQKMKNFLRRKGTVVC